MATITDYMWDKCRSYFLKNYFLPFLFLNYLPLVVIAFCVSWMDKHAGEEHPMTWVFLFYYLSIIMFVVGTVF